MFYRSILHHRQFRYLGAFYIHSLVRIFAVSLFQVFSGIYIFQTLRGFGVENQQALGTVALLFALVFLVQSLAIAPAIWLISKKGLKFAVFWGNIFLVGFFILLFLGKVDPIFFVIAAVLSGLQIGLYWTAYHIYFAELTDDRKQGEEIGLNVSMSASISIGGPAFGGMLISYVGFEALFVVMTILIILANYPLKFLPKDKDLISVDIIRTVLALAPKEEQKSYLALLGAGTLDTVSLIFWPIFIFPIVTGFIGIGFMGSLVALVSMVTTVLAGFLIDKYGAKKLINVISSLDSILWVAKVFVYLPIQAFILSAINSFTITGQLISMDSLVYERARRVNLVAFIVQREFGLAIGKFLFLLIIGLLFWFGLPLPFVFILTAFLALATRLYPDEPLVIAPTHPAHKE